MSEWISVKERLPEELERTHPGWSYCVRPSEDVLVYLRWEKRQTVAWYSYADGNWATVDERTIYDYDEITHWMPLPEPPKEENNVL